MRLARFIQMNFNVGVPSFDQGTARTSCEMDENERVVSVGQNFQFSNM